MKKLVWAVSLTALLALPAISLAAQGICANVTGKATISPGLEAVPVASGTFSFGDLPAPETCAGDNMWAGIASNGTLTAPSCNGNVHQGKVTAGKATGLQFQGVCAGNTCDGGGVLGGQGAYQLVFDAATVQAALDKCDPGDGDGGLTSASFLGAIEAKAP